MVECLCTSGPISFVPNHSNGGSGQTGMGESPHMSNGRYYRPNGDFDSRTKHSTFRLGRRLLCNDGTHPASPSADELGATVGEEGRGVH